MSIFKKIAELFTGQKKHYKRTRAHKNAQKAGKVRDLFTCQFCGSTSSPQGHHIRHLAHGGKAHKDNIITLCSTCHQNVHKGKSRVSKF